MNKQDGRVFGNYPFYGRSLTINDHDLINVVCVRNFDVFPANFNVTELAKARICLHNYQVTKAGKESAPFILLPGYQSS